MMSTSLAAGHVPWPAVMLNFAQAATASAAAPAPTPAPVEVSVQQMAVGAAIMVSALLGVAGLVIFLTGAYRRQSLLGPARRPPGGLGWPLVLGGFLAFGLLMLLQFVLAPVFVIAAGGELAPDASEKHPVPIYLAATTAQFITFGIGLGAIALLARPMLRRLGLRGGRLGQGALAGLLGVVAGLPLAMTAGILSGLAFKIVGIEPDSHPLLDILRREDGLALVAIAFLAAAVGAPLVEELIFRGLLQTGFVHVAARWFARDEGTGQGSRPVGMPVQGGFDPVLAARGEQPTIAERMAYSSSAGGGVGTPGSIPPPPGAPGREAYLRARTQVHEAHEAHEAAGRPGGPPHEDAEDETGHGVSTGPGVTARAVGIVVTSLLFAVIHPYYSWAAIFVLSLVLGYVYERTGSLWGVILLHALFNGAMLTLTLLASQFTGPA